MKNAEWQNGVTHMNIFARINELLDYAEKNGLIEKEDRIYSRNLLIDALRLDDFEEVPADQNAEIEDILRDILDYAYENGIIPDNGVTQRDLFDARIMGLLTPRPSRPQGSGLPLNLQLNVMCLCKWESPRYGVFFLCKDLAVALEGVFRVSRGHLTSTRAEISLVQSLALVISPLPRPAGALRCPPVLC